MSKLIMLSGLPASGKSTRAKEIVAQGNWVRLNRDLLREMLHCGKWSGRNEGVTVDVEKSIALLLLRDNMNVVIDDTNLNPKNKEMWKEVANAAGMAFEHEPITTSWTECLERDKGRANPVGPHVIKSIALQYGFVQPLSELNEKGWILCDLDGTLAYVEHRRHFVQQDPKDWKGFFEAMTVDPVRMEVSRMVTDYHNEGYGIIYVSARPEQYRQKTENWLAHNALGFGFTLLMRREGDTRPDTEVKKQILDTYFPDKSCIFKVIDDRPQVIVGCWIPFLGKEKVIDVGNNDYFIEERKELNYWTIV
jgi:predicted kinase